MTQPIPRLSSLFKLEYPQSVGVYATYDEAQKVVDFLADARFPVENLCIVGTDLRSIERVLGRQSWGRVIGAGVQSGVSTGLMITLLLWIVMPQTNILLLFLSAVAIGIVIGIAFAALGYWMSQGKRDFRSVSQTVATKYELLAEHKVAGQAREMIAGMPGARAAQFNPAQAPFGQAPFGQAPASPSGYPGGFAQPGQPPAGYPQGYGQPGYPPSGYPGPGYPQPGYGAPQSAGHPQPAVPGLGYPEQAPPEHPGQQPPADPRPEPGPEPEQERRPD